MTVHDLKVEYRTIHYRPERFLLFNDHQPSTVISHNHLTMATYAFAAGLQVISRPEVAPPPAAKTKDRSPAIELQNIDNNLDHGRIRTSSLPDSPAGSQTPLEACTQPQTGSQTPRTPKDLEATMTSFQGGETNATGLVPSFLFPAMNKWRVLCACLTYFGNGMNDSGKSSFPYSTTAY